MNKEEIKWRFNLLKRVAEFFRSRLVQIRSEQYSLLRGALERRDREEMENIRRDFNKE